jgi:hypothetical protein
MASEAIIARQIVDSTTDSRTIIVGSGMVWDNTNKEITLATGRVYAGGTLAPSDTRSGVTIGSVSGTATVLLKGDSGNNVRLDNNIGTFRLLCNNAIVMTATETNAAFSKPLRFSNPSETANTSNTGVCQFTNSAVNVNLFSFRVNSAADFLLDSDFGANDRETIKVTRSTRVVSFYTGVDLLNSANLSVGTTTGSKIGTATTQKIGFWNATPAVQPAAIADATSEADAVTKLNDLLAKLRTIGIIGT